MGLGFLSAQGLALIVGATAYALGWIYLPDMGFFRKWVDRMRDQAKRAAALAQLAVFEQRREALLASLSPNRRERYHALAVVCQTIETAGAESPMNTSDSAGAPRWRRLDEEASRVRRIAGQMRDASDRAAVLAGRAFEVSAGHRAETIGATAGRLATQAEAHASVL